MAPERFTNGPIDTGVDVYALGCLLYQCLTGRTPFEGSEAPALMYAHVHLDPPRPSAAVPGLPDALDEVVVTAMAKDPADRYATTGELGDAARAALRGTATVPPRAVPTTERATVVTPRSTRPDVEAGDDPPTGPASTHRPTHPPSSRPRRPRRSRSRHPGRSRRRPRAVRAPGLSDDRRPRGVRRRRPGAARRGMLVALRGGDDRRDRGRRGPGRRRRRRRRAAGRPRSVGSVPTPATPGSLTVAPGGRVAYVGQTAYPRVVTVVDLARGRAADRHHPGARRSHALHRLLGRWRRARTLSAYTRRTTRSTCVQVVDTAHPRRRRRRPGRPPALRPSPPLRTAARAGAEPRRRDDRPPRRQRPTRSPGGLPGGRQPALGGVRRRPRLRRQPRVAASSR